MDEELTVLLVGDGEPDAKLVDQLEKKNLAVEISAKDELRSLLALVEPHIVVHIGRDGAEQTAAFLKENEAVRRVRLIVLADRADLPGLRQLDRGVVASLLATDIAPSVIAARVLMLAKKGPEQSLRPPSAVARKPSATAKKPSAAAKDHAPAAKRAPGITAPRSPKIEAKAPEVPAQNRGASAQAPHVAMPPKTSEPEPVTKRPADFAVVPPTAQPASGQPAGSQGPRGVPRAASKAARPAQAPGGPTTGTPANASGPSSAPPSEFPTTAVEAPIPPDAKPSSMARQARVVLADTDVTRADLIACALREAKVQVRIVPLDAAATHWPLIREFSPTVLLTDGAALKSSGQVWLQLFQADQAFKKTKVVAVPFSRLCRVERAEVNLRMLIPQIPQISSELNEAKPTAGPELPSEATTAEPSSPASDEPAPEFGQEDEFDRLTLAVEVPLPKEATRAPAVEPPGQFAADELTPSVPPESLDEIELLQSLPPDETGPDPSQLAPRADRGQTPRPTSAPAGAEKSGGGMKWAVAAIVALVAAGTAAWFVMGQRLPGIFSLDPDGAQSSTKAPQVPGDGNPAPPPDPDDEAPKKEEPPPSAQDVMWQVQSEDAPDCKTLVTNLDELQPGGAQQATLSLARARKAMVRGKLDEALRLMCEAVLVHPESMALEELAALYLMKKSPEHALNWHAQAMQVRPERARTIELGGDIYSQLGRVEDAKAAFVASLGVDPEDEETLAAVAKQFAERGQRQLRSGALAKAELLFRRAATLDPDSVDAAAGMTATKAGTGNVPASRKWAEHTLELDEGNPIALVVMAALATEEGDQEQALQLTEKALERDPNYAPGRQLREKLTSE